MMLVRMVRIVSGDDGEGGGEDSEDDMRQAD